jgi:hypothetical protein
MVSGLTRDWFLVSEEGKYRYSVGNMRQEGLRLGHVDALADYHQDLGRLVHVCVTSTVYMLNV